MKFSRSKGTCLLDTDPSNFFSVFFFPSVKIITVCCEVNYGKGGLKDKDVAVVTGQFGICDPHE